MATSVSYRCGRCSKEIAKELSYLFHSIGVPYIQCPHCGSPNLRSASVNEWDLMTWSLKFRCFGEVTLVGAFFGAAVGSAGITMAQDRIGLAGPSGVWAALSLFFGAALGITVMSQRLKSRIRKSRERLKDEDYAAMLLDLGIASGTVPRLSAGPANRSGTNYGDRLVSEVARDYAYSLCDFYDQVRKKSPHLNSKESD